MSLVNQHPVTGKSSSSVEGILQWLEKLSNLNLYNEMQLNKFKHIKEDLMQEVYTYFRSTKDFIVTDICFYTSKNEVPK